MGLSVSHDAFKGLYGSYIQWKTRLAELAGYIVLRFPTVEEQHKSPFNGQLKYDPRLDYPVIFIDWGHITQANLHGYWDETPADPLMVLIAHADESGFIYERELRAVRERLLEMIPIIEEKDPELFAWHGVLARTHKFILGIDRALAAGEPLEFS